MTIGVLFGFKSVAVWKDSSGVIRSVSQKRSEAFEEEGMEKRWKALENAFGVLTVVLAVLGILTVTPYAWADDGGSSGSALICPTGCTPCDWPCTDSCFGPDGCGPPACSCTVAGASCTCV